MKLVVHSGCPNFEVSVCVCVFVCVCVCLVCLSVRLLPRLMFVNAQNMSFCVSHFVFLFSFMCNSVVIVFVQDCFSCPCILH